MKISWRWKPRIWFLISQLAGLGGFALVVWSAVAYLNTHDYMAVPLQSMFAEVRAEPGSISGESLASYTVFVEYRYIVSGSTYTGRRVLPWGNSWISSKSAIAMQRESGELARCASSFVDPRNPRRAVLFRWPRASALSLLAPLAFILIAQAVLGLLPIVARRTGVRLSSFRPDTVFLVFLVTVGPAYCLLALLFPLVFSRFLPSCVHAVMAATVVVAMLYIVLGFVRIWANR